ncbi:hypothetical protein LA76x_3174 [Lysobacter antibioticus]|uniref:Uncharacterized protein n=1 Tax=Lysobacter antibioticus TaxID=84531 RepID=A0A0S2FCS1_LYSAN|nr:hypothetical protein LA76x_3174 [Lysobacter antibioticus]
MPDSGAKLKAGTVVAGAAKRHSVAGGGGASVFVRDRGW